MHNVSSIYMYVICLHTLCFPLIFLLVFSLVLLSARCVYVVVKFHIMKGPSANAPEN